MRHYKTIEQIGVYFGFQLPEKIRELYIDQKMSCPQIAEYIKQNSGQVITARSIQRHLAKNGLTRTVAQSYKNAMSTGRMRWAYKEYKTKRSTLSKRLRYEVLERDVWRCVLCGNTPKTGAILEVDHIVPMCKGGTSHKNNLRTLCYECNQGKRLTEKEV